MRLEKRRRELSVDQISEKLLYLALGEDSRSGQILRPPAAGKPHVV